MTDSDRYIHTYIAVRVREKNLGLWEEGVWEKKRKGILSVKDEKRSCVRKWVCVVCKRRKQGKLCVRERKDKKRGKRWVSYKGRPNNNRPEGQILSRLFKNWRRVRENGEQMMGVNKCIEDIDMFKIMDRKSAREWEKGSRRKLCVVVNRENMSVCTCPYVWTRGKMCICMEGTNVGACGVGRGKMCVSACR